MGSRIQFSSLVDTLTIDSNMVRLGFFSILATAVSGGSPPVWEHAKVARWMTKTLNWGVMSTISTRDEATTVGDAFGNPYSHADVAGVPYFFASDLDASMIDI